jgi:hypothetical protein
MNEGIEIGKQKLGEMKGKASEKWNEAKDVAASKADDLKFKAEQKKNQIKSDIKSVSVVLPIFPFFNFYLSFSFLLFFFLILF